MRCRGLAVIVHRLISSSRSPVSEMKKPQGVGLSIDVAPGVWRAATAGRGDAQHTESQQCEGGRFRKLDDRCVDVFDVDQT